MWKYTFTYKILQYTCFNCTCSTCSYDKCVWDMSQYNKLSEIQYARFQILPVDLHFGLFWSSGSIATMQLLYFIYMATGYVYNIIGQFQDGNWFIHKNRKAYTITRHIVVLHMGALLGDPVGNVDGDRWPTCSLNSTHRMTNFASWMGIQTAII